MAAKKKPAGSKPFAGAKGAKGRKPRPEMTEGKTSTTGRNVKINNGRRFDVSIYGSTAETTRAYPRTKSFTRAEQEEAIRKALATTRKESSKKLGGLDYGTDLYQISPNKRKAANKGKKK